MWRNRPRTAAWAPIEKVGLAFAKTGHTRRVDISEQTFADDSARQLDFLQELDNRRSVLDRTGTVLRASALPSSSAASALHTAVRTPCLASLDVRHIGSARCATHLPGFAAPSRLGTFCVERSCLPHPLAVSVNLAQASRSEHFAGQFGRGEPVGAQHERPA